MVTGRPDEPEPDEPLWDGLVRVVTGAPAEVGAELPCEGLVRVVTGAPAEGVPTVACDALLRVATEAAAGDPAPTEDLLLPVLGAPLPVPA